MATPKRGEECQVFDLGGESIKHWRSEVGGETVYSPATYGGDLDNLFRSFETFVPKDDDVWICGYPKSGNNWLHENICMLLSGKPEPYNRLMVHSFVDFLPNLDTMSSRPSPRVFHTHFSYNRLPASVRQTSKIIVIMRNPKSTSVSHYHHMRNASHNRYRGKFEDFWPVYINGFIQGYLYHDWFTYNKEYFEASKLHGNVMVVLYEDLVLDQVKELAKLSTFLGLKRTDEFHTKVMQLTTKASLINNWEHKHPDDLKFVRKLDPTLIYRKGIIDDWKNHFTVEDNERFDQIYLDKMADAPGLTEKIRFQ